MVHLLDSWILPLIVDWFERQAITHTVHIYPTGFMPGLT